ncbi:MAG: hypothetical protein HY907_22175 [Deltaproteobacteria bacterium]|nr:hypothetical protein [Deltaproteobacteria bacterium]
MFICGFLLFSAPSRADDTHYQNQLIGERALGLGGAFTAVASDPTASFYNPAGLAMTLSSSISASLNLYGVEHRIVHGGFVSYIGGERESADLETTSFPTIPTTFGILRAFGERLPDGSRRHAIAFSMLIPDQTAISYDATIGRSGQTDLDVFRLSESDKTLWVGPSYAIRITDDLSLGLSAFVAIRTWSRATFRSMETPSDPPTEPPTAEFFDLERVDAAFDSYDLIFRLGALYRPLPGVRVGFTIGFPSIHVYGDGSLSKQLTYARFEPPLEYGDMQLESASGLSATSFDPLEIRLGLAWEPAEGMLVAFDASYHLPTFSSYERIELGSDDRARLAFDDLFATEVERRGVLNANVGFEWVIEGEWPLRLGAFTNFSAAPPLRPYQPGLERIDIVGGTISAGYNFDAFSVNVGFLGSVGWGQAQALNLVGDPTYLERDARYDLFYFFVSGAARVVAETLETLIEAAPEEEGGESGVE